MYEIGYVYLRNGEEKDMEIRDNVGAVKTILSAVPAVEERRVFNGNVRRNFEPCRVNGVEANAVIFYAENGVGFHGCTAQFAICNLTSDSVDYILTELLQKGAVDLSVYKYQPKKDFDEKYIFDNGKSRAYWSNMAIFPPLFSSTTIWDARSCNAGCHSAGG